MSDFKPTKDQLQILEQLKEVTEPYYVYSDQMIAIAKWIDAEFKQKCKANEANKQPDTEALRLQNVMPRYFVVGYLGTQPMGVTTGTINIWGDTNYLSRAKATRIIEESNEGIKDVVITSVNELNEKDFEAWRGNGA